MRRTSSLRFLYAFNFLKSLQFFGALAVPFYLDRLQYTYTEMFSLEAIFSFCVMAFEVPTGVIADRFGRKASLALGSLAFGSGFFLFGAFRSFPVLVLAEIVCALGLSLLSGADRAILYELAKTTGDERNATKINARYDAFGTAGMLIAFPLGSLFASARLVPYLSALGLVFTATGATCFLAATALIPLKEPSRVAFHGNSLRAGIEGFKYIFKVPALARLGLNYTLISSLTFFMFWFYQSLLIKNSFPLGLYGLIPAGFNLGAMLLLLATGPIERTLGLRHALFISSLVPGLLYLGVFLVPGLAMALAAIFGVTILKLFRAPLLTALMNGYIEDENRATVLSGISMIERAMTMLFYPLAGLLTDISLDWTFLAMGAITVFIAVFLRIDERHFKANAAS
jgi:MFS family permease